MFSFRGFLFFKNLSYKFGFSVDNFKRPLVIKGFCRVFLSTEIVLQGSEKNYKHKSHDIP